MILQQQQHHKKIYNKLPDYRVNSVEKHSSSGHQPFDSYQVERILAQNMEFTTHIKNLQSTVKSLTTQMDSMNKSFLSKFQSLT